MNKKYSIVQSKCNRTGAIAPLFALLVPVVILVCGIAVNIAWMQLNKTELRVATDSAARAAGRAFSEFQNVDTAIAYAVTTAEMNEVGGKALELREEDQYDEIQFGTTTRESNGFGRFTFTKVSTQAVRSGGQGATAVRVVGKRDSTSVGGTIQMLFAGYGPFTEFEPIVAATSTQVDRDIALVLDRSGSMAEAVIDYGNYYSWYWGWTDPDMQQEYYEWDEDYDDWQDARGYSEAPRHSRWEALEAAVQAFLIVLEDTDQDELVSLTTFSSGNRWGRPAATLDQTLTVDYDLIRDEMDGKRVWGGTAIGSGMSKANPSLFGSLGRPYAAKTIIVLTDGNHNSGSDPETVAESLVNSYNVIIHTITFSEFANQSKMRDVARIGGGKHYHAETEAELVAVFQEIANNLPTIITE